MKINALEIELTARLSDIGSSHFTYRLLPAPDVDGEQVFRNSTVEAIRVLLNIRDKVAEATRSGFDPDSLVALAETVGLIPGNPWSGNVPGGNVFAKVRIDGTRQLSTGNICGAVVAEMTLYRNFAEVVLPLDLGPGELLFSEIVFEETVVDRVELKAPPEGLRVEKIEVPSVVVPRIGMGLATGCFTCGRPLRLGEVPPVEDVVREDGGPRRWKCAECLAASLFPAVVPPVVDKHGRPIVFRNATTGNYAVKCSDGLHLVMNPAGTHYWFETSDSKLPDWSFEHYPTTGIVEAGGIQAELHLAPVFRKEDADPMRGGTAGPAVAIPLDFPEPEKDSHGRSIVAVDSVTKNRVVRCGDGNFLVMNGGGTNLPPGTHWWSESFGEWNCEGLHDGPGVGTLSNKDDAIAVLGRSPIYTGTRRPSVGSGPSPLSEILRERTDDAATDPEPFEEGSGPAPAGQ